MKLWDARHIHIDTACNVSPGTWLVLQVGTLHTMCAAAADPCPHRLLPLPMLTIKPAAAARATCSPSPPL